MVAWDAVTRPKTKGELGVLCLETQNDALLMKFLHKFYNRMEIPWVSLIWNNHYRNGRLPDGKFRVHFGGEVI